MIRQIINTPWKAWNFISSLISFPIVRAIFAINRIPWNSGWKFYGIPVIQKHRQSTITLGTGLSLRSTVRSNPLGATHPVILCTWQAGAELQIGDNFGMTGGSIVAARSIRIGERVTIGANCTIIDTDFHPIDSEERQTHPQEGKTAPIVIENDVFIGMNCLILKGVRLGEGAVIGAGSVIAEDVPPKSIIVGSPSRKITKS